MAWVKLDDQWMDHPKIIEAGRDARDMWLASITWCAKHLTDGFFPANLIPQLAVMAGADVANCQEFASRLLALCLWDATDNGYMVHDYLEYNPSRETVISTREARKEAGSAGGKAKASKNRSKMLANEQQKSAPSPSPDPEKKKSIEAKPRDPLLDNPAVMAYRDVCRLTPNEIQRADIAARIDNVDLWRTVCADWMRHGWKPGNIPGLIEAYQDGGIRSNGNKPAQPKFDRNRLVED